MKKMLCLLLLSLPTVLPAQVVMTATSDLFAGKVTASWIKTPTDSGFVVLESSATAADTMYSNELDARNSNGEIHVSVRLVKNISGTLNAKLQVGLYRGPGVQSDNDTSNGARGWEWHDLVTFTSVSDTYAVVNDYSWAYKRPFRKYQYRILEIGTQQNWYVLNNHQY